MSLDVESRKAGPGRPRSEGSRKAILEAALAVMREVGLRSLTFERVAADAGVSKATIYRWWPSKGTLALDAYQSGLLRILPAALPGTGSLRTDLYELLRPIAEAIAEIGPDRLWTQIVAEAQSDPRLAATIYARLITPYRQIQQPIFDAAIERGEVPPDLDTTILMDVLYGAYYHRLLLNHGMIDVEFFKSVVDLVLDGVLIAARGRATARDEGS